CAELRRTAIGRFRVDDAIAPADVAADRLIAPAALLSQLPGETVDAPGAIELGFGRRVRQLDPVDGIGALLAEDGRLLAVAEGRDGWWHPTVVLEPSQ
ncbi:MAG: hypothetical protein ABUL71_01835, partial [Gemmatimonadota bacterium]